MRKLLSLKMEVVKSAGEIEETRGIEQNLNFEDSGIALIQVDSGSSSDGKEGIEGKDETEYESMTDEGEVDKGAIDKEIVYEDVK